MQITNGWQDENAEDMRFSIFFVVSGMRIMRRKRSAGQKRDEKT